MERGKAMTAEKWGKKIDYFTDTIAREVNARKRKTMHQLASKLSGDVSAKLSAAETKLKYKQSTEKRQISQNINKYLAQVAFEEKSKYMNMKNRHISQLFEDVRRDLKSFTQTIEYAESVILHIEQIKQKHEFTIVQISPADMHLSEKIRTATGLAVEECEADIIGGFIMLTANRKIRADYTFKTRLAEIGFNTHGAPWHR